MKVIPHHKPVRDPKPKRYRVEFFSTQEHRWKLRNDYRTARSAKAWARYHDQYSSHLRWRVVDTRG